MAITCRNLAFMLLCAAVLSACATRGGYDGRVSYPNQYPHQGDNGDRD